MEQTTYRLSIRTLFGSAWEHFKTRPWFFIGITLFTIILSTVFQDAADRVKEMSPLVAFFFSLATFFIETLVMMGYYSILMRSLGGSKPEFSELFTASPSFWYFLVTTILFGAAVVGGFILLIIPGFMALSAWCLATLIVIDTGKKPVVAFRESARLTKGIRLQMLRFIIVTGIINCIGALLFGIGLLVTYPVSFLASILLYRELSVHRAVSLPEETKTS